MKKDFNREMEKAQKIYSDLLLQKESAHSTTLATLLSRELDAYLRVKQTFEEYEELYQKKVEHIQTEKSKVISNARDCAQKIADTGISEPILQRANAIYNDWDALVKIDMAVHEQAIRIYLNAISRDIKDWKAFAKNVGKITGDLVLDISSNISPVLSAAKFCCDIVQSVADIKKEYEDKGTNYFKADKQLRIIELHTEMLDNAFEMFVQLKKTVSPKNTTVS